jgi:hypothetical protein
MWESRRNLLVSTDLGAEVSRYRRRPMAGPMPGAQRS